MQQSKHQEYQMLLGNLAISNYWGEELVPLNVYGGYRNTFFLNNNNNNKRILLL